MIHTICYTSKANPSLTKRDIEQIFNKTYTNNSLKGVTGILLHGLDNFFQVLEGKEKLILPLYNNLIKSDERHHSIFEIINKPKSKALFLDYSSDFTIVRTQKQLDTIKLYLKEHDVSTSDKLQRLLNPFIL